MTTKKKKKKACIQWYTSDHYGRLKPPVGPYRPHIRIGDQEWSLLVEPIDEPNTEFPTLAWISFVFDDAPHEALKSGLQFQLFEGRWAVAGGQIL